MTRIVKFLVAGMIGVSVNLGVFHLLYLAGVPYLAGSAGGFLVAVVVGFVLQKFWTFTNSSHEYTRKQFFWYALLALANLALNTGIVYVLVGKLGFHYLFAQAIGAAVVAVDSFFVYKFFIFVGQK